MTVPTGVHPFWFFAVWSFMGFFIAFIFTLCYDGYKVEAWGKKDAAWMFPWMVGSWIFELAMLIGLGASYLLYNLGVVI